MRDGNLEDFEGVCELMDSYGNCVSKVKKIEKSKYYVLVTTIGGNFRLVQDFHKLIVMLVRELRGPDYDMEVVLIGNFPDTSYKRQPTRNDFIKAYSDDMVKKNRGIIFNYGHGASNAAAFLFKENDINDDTYEYIAASDIKKGNVNIRHKDIISMSSICYQRQTVYAEEWKKILPNAVFHFPRDPNSSERTREIELLPQFLNDLVKEINRVGSKTIPKYEYRSIFQNGVELDIEASTGCIGIVDGDFVCEFCDRLKNKNGCSRCAGFGRGMCSSCVQNPCNRKRCKNHKMRRDNTGCSNVNICSKNGSLVCGGQPRGDLE